jgi:hypothetical protein
MAQPGWSPAQGGGRHQGPGVEDGPGAGDQIPTPDRDEVRVSGARADEPDLTHQASRRAPTLKQVATRGRSS